MPVTVSTFYKFVPIGNCSELSAQLDTLCTARAIKGTILLAREGINATLSGTDDDVRAVHSWLRADPRFAGLVSKESRAPGHPFGRLKIKIKSEIVTFGVPKADPAQDSGTYVKPEDWNDLISGPDVTLIDTRNAYEVAIGTFQGAIDPNTSAFSEFPQFAADNLDPARHRKVAMFCTGGIRCEKASAYLLSLGFAQVYHLEGGILKYLETVPEADSLWHGECFVFDERVALEHGVKPGDYALCAACGAPVSQHNAAASARPLCLACRCGAGGEHLLDARDGDPVKQ